MNLEPVVEAELRGRFAFRIHGDTPNHDASNGCIILAHADRVAVWESGDDALFVTGE
jgi:hypothetical protein